MGMNHYKVTYECDCGCDYGSCQRRNFFLLEMSRSADEPDSKLEVVWFGGDAGMKALAKIIDCEDSTEKYDESDFEEIKQVRGW